MTDRQTTSLARLREFRNAESTNRWLSFLDAEIEGLSAELVIAEEDTCIHRLQGAVRNLNSIKKRITK